MFEQRKMLSLLTQVAMILTAYFFHFEYYELVHSKTTNKVFVSFRHETLMTMMAYINVDLLIVYFYTACTLFVPKSLTFFEQLIGSDRP